MRRLGSPIQTELELNRPSTDSASLRRDDRSLGYAILAASLLLGVAIRLLIIRYGVEIADVEHAHGIANYFLSGKDPYRLPPFQSNYPPGALVVEAATLLVANVTALPFHAVFKLWSVAADVVVAYLLFLVLRAERRSARVAALWTSAFLLNPVAIIITAAHGQLDPITNCCCVASLVLLLKKPARRFGWSALALGLAISIKPNPALLLPIFASVRGLSWLQRMAYVVVAALPTGLLLLPFLVDDAPGVITNIVGYPGEYDFGFAAVLRGAWFLKTGSLWLPATVGPDLSATSRLAFLAVYVAVLAVGGGRVGLAKLVTIQYLAFQVFFSGLSAQYTVWIVPFAILAGDWFVIVYSIATAGSLVGFYLLFWPGILLGRLNTLNPLQASFGPLYLWAMLLAWLVDAVWFLRLGNAILRRYGAELTQMLIRLAKSRGQSLLRPDGPRPVLLALGVALFLVSVVPIAQILHFMLLALSPTPP
jgi:hypothetical protein